MSIYYYSIILPTSTSPPLPLHPPVMNTQQPPERDITWGGNADVVCATVSTYNFNSQHSSN